MPKISISSKNKHQYILVQLTRFSVPVQKPSKYYQFWCNVVNKKVISVIAFYWQSLMCDFRNIAYFPLKMDV